MQYILLVALTLANALAMQASWPPILSKLGTSQTVWGDIGVLIVFIITYVGPVALGVLAGLVLSRQIAW